MTGKNFTEFLLYYAKTIPAGKRMEFMNSISSFAGTRRRPVFDETIFDKISDLRDQIMKKMTAIEDGSFCDDYDWEDGYDDAEPPPFRRNSRRNWRSPNKSRTKPYASRTRCC